MFPRRAHVTAPLTDLTGKGKFQWLPKHQKAFDEMKAVMAADATMYYPDQNKPYHVYVDASDYQMGACIMQDNKPVAYWSKKLNAAQRNYTTMEKELLSAVMVLKEFRTFLLGTDLHIHTDHKNLTYANLNSSRVLRWRLYLEEYGPKFHYIKGNENVLADAFSRLPRKEPISEGKSASQTQVDEQGAFSLFDDPELFECFLNMPTPGEMQMPLRFDRIRDAQEEDDFLKEQVQTANPLYVMKQLQADVSILCYRPELNTPENQWKIAIPDSLLNDTILWHHRVLGHAGSQRVYETIRRLYYHPVLHSTILRLRCAVCQLCKLPGPGYGHLPPREAGLVPWEEIAVDLIGPWTIHVGNMELKFQALTCIDTVTNLVELVRIDDKQGDTVATKFDHTWLACYPWPT